MLFNKSWLASWLNPWKLDYNTNSRGLLLDTMAAPAVAFSTRKLRTAYSGQCLRVRRSSDNAEQDIGFVAGKLDTASLLTFVGAGDGFVTTWYDQSGNGRNATQATAAKQLYVVQSGATIAFGSQGDVAILNPAENRVLDYSHPVISLAIGHSCLFVHRRPVATGAVSWALAGGAGPYWVDSGLFDAAPAPVMTPNTVARTVVTRYLPGDKVLRSSNGTATGATSLTYSPANGKIGTYTDGYGAPMNCQFHTCVVWSGSIADVESTYLATAAWL